MLKIIDKNQSYEKIKVICSSNSILIHIKTNEFIKCILILENGLISESITPIT